jgi:hypothetical protein
LSARRLRDARTREVEIKEHELRLLQEQVGTSNAARVRLSSSHFFFGSSFVEVPAALF